MHLHEDVEHMREDWLQNGAAVIKKTHLSITLTNTFSGFKQRPWSVSHSNKQVK